MATKTLNTRITLKADTTANWDASTLVLLKGEQAFEITESGAWKAKVGDGVNTFKDLSYITMTPEEISSLIASGAIQTISLASGTNNGTLKLTVDGVTTDNIAVKGLGTAAYTNAGAYATAAQGTLATNAVRKVATGTANGTISVTTGTGAATNVAVKGLGSAAYTASNAYATAAQGTKADNAMPKGGGTFTGAVTLAADPTADLQPTTKQYVDSKISSSIAASDAMVFKGTLGTNGTATALPASSVVVGDTYKVITQVTVPKTNSYTGADVVAKIGDLVVAMSKDPKWIVVPSGDEIVTTVKYSTTTQNLTTNAQSGAITVGEAATKQVDTSITSGTTSTKLPTSKAVADYVTWGNVAGKPSTFTPSAHTHTKDQVGLGNVDNTADKNKSVKYATSAGYANSALKLQTYKQGSTTETYGTQYMLYAQWEDSSNLRLKIDNYTTKVNYADNAGNAASASSVDWSNVKNKPSTYTPSAHTHTIAQITNLQSTLDGKSNNGHTHDDRYYTESEMDAKLAGKANVSHGHNNIGCYGTNTINTVANDTTENWASKANSVHFYNTKGLLNGQPSQYGFLFNMAFNDSEIHQIWATHGGSLYHRYGNKPNNINNIEKSWREILDSSNYTSYTVTKTGSGASGTWGISIGGNAATSSKCTGNAATATVADSAKSCTGNSASATKLATARNFSISGGATAAAVSFNGTGNATLSVTSLNTDYLSNGSNTLILACGGA